MKSLDSECKIACIVVKKYRNYFFNPKIYKSGVREHFFILTDVLKTKKQTSKFLKESAKKFRQEI